MTAWLGFTHALQRRVRQHYADFVIEQTGVVCHDLQVLTHRGANDFQSSIIVPAAPLTKDGTRPAIMEEPRCHCEVSLLLKISDIPSDDEEEAELLTVIQQMMHRLKIAGGDLLRYQTPKYYCVNDDDSHSRLVARLARLCHY